MKNRMHPGTPPSGRGDRRQPDDGKSPLDRVAKVSRALKELIRQQGILGPGKDQGAFYDLVAIYRAAKSDPGMVGFKFATPLEFTVDHDHAVSALDDSDPTRCLVDRHAAFSYVSDIDPRVQMAVGNQMMANTARAVQADPIQAGVDSCRGGMFGLMFTTGPVLAKTGMAQEDYFGAVMERAREQAAEMDPIAAESFVDNVRKAIEGCPRIEFLRQDPGAGLDDE